MAIDILFQDVEGFEINEDRLFESLEFIVNDFDKVLGDVALVFCSDAYILQVNMQYLSHDYYTDIITFDYCEGSVVSGDLLISIDTVQSNANSYRIEFVDELMRVVVHGVLHLCGLGDKSESELLQMRSTEDKYLSLCANPFQ
jgi:probable rRNA maturation factor